MTPDIGETISSTQNSPQIVYAGFGIVLFCFLLLSITGLILSDRLDDELKQITSDHNRKVELALELYDTARTRSDTLFSMLILSDPFDLDESYMRFQRLGNLHMESRFALSKLSLNKNEREALERGRDLAAQVGPALLEIAEHLALGDKDTAERKLTHQIIQTHEAALTAFKSLELSLHEEDKTALDQAGRKFADTIRLITYSSFAVLILGSIITVIVGKRVRRATTALHKTGLQLEQRVNDRTKQLLTANLRLKEEINERTITQAKLQQMAHYWRRL